MSFISKILEKVVLYQLQSHLKINNLLDINQSAYKHHHSTETALLHVIEGLLVNADNRLLSVLALLDLSAAFDTIDHEILIQRLQISFGIEGRVLQWFISYLDNRSQTVLIDQVKSNSTGLKYGVPQGSVLGPILFTLYTMPLSDLIQTYDCDYHKFADDTQLSKSAHLEHFPLLVKNVEDCIESITKWMVCNKLKLNPEKSEILPIGPQSKLSKLEIDTANINGTDIHFTSCARDLGVHIDSNLSMKKHISHICKVCYFELRRISQMKQYLPSDCLVQLVSCFVLSRLDYCNSVLAGLPKSSLNKLQKVQNSAARLILNKSKREHITPLLVKLHWLPVHLRIDYKLAVFGFKFFEGTLPKYLSDSLKKYEPLRTLRSANDNKLVVPVRYMKSFGERAFSSQVPRVWNKLPSVMKNCNSLVSFKKQLKTFLFKEAYNS